MLKKITQLLMLILILVTFIQCKKNDPTFHKANCAVIMRADIDGDNNYEYIAHGFIVSEKNCNANILGPTFTLSSSEALKAQKADYSAAISELSHTDCSTSKSKVENLLNSATAANIETNANGLNPKCTTVGNLGGDTVYCTSQEEVEKYKTNILYQPVDNVLSDMSVSLAFNQALQTVHMASTGFTENAIKAMEPYNEEAVAVKKSAGYLGYSYAVFEGGNTEACRKTILDRNANLKKIIERSVGKNITMGTSGSQVTSVLAQILCRYGDDWIETTADPGDGSSIIQVGTCPASYPSF